MIYDSSPSAGRKNAIWPSLAATILPLLLASATALHARPWSFVGIPEPIEAELMGIKNGGVVLQGPNGKNFEVPITSFAPADQTYLRLLEAGTEQESAVENPGKPITSPTGYTVKSVKLLTNQVATLTAGMELHVTGKDDPLAGSTILFTAPDGWLFLDNIAPSTVASKFLGRMLVNRAKAELDGNVRVVQYGSGTVVIPQGPDYPAMTVFEGKSATGTSAPLTCYTAYDDSELRPLKGAVGSFILKRGYMATLAEKPDGTGVSKNYVAQDHDLKIDALPPGLEDGVGFIRIFPWRWVSKKGICGGIWQNLNVAWFYDWNIKANSTLDLEYVAIRQNRGWPGLDQDWRAKGVNHLLGFNEPDRPDQANMNVADAIKSWPTLLASGLRLGAPATSDGGLAWLYEFMEKADSAGLRVDFVPVHYYRATNDPGDAKGAADQFHRFLKQVHDRVKRPLWVTEWNNGANWTKAPDPNAKQQKEAIAAILKMLDETPFVERYALYNWVEDVRHVVAKDQSLTPAGEVYRDQVSPLSFIQPKGEK
ncbi:MAG: glycosyl hydrolase [Akkermansiaceae bacterium]